MTADGRGTSTKTTALNRAGLQSGMTSDASWLRAACQRPPGTRQRVREMMSFMISLVPP
jgi:hypothetical protein